MKLLASIPRKAWSRICEGGLSHKQICPFTYAVRCAKSYENRANLPVLHSFLPFLPPRLEKRETNELPVKSTRLTGFLVVQLCHINQVGQDIPGFYPEGGKYVFQAVRKHLINLFTGNPVPDGL